jgi:hypothetical protein
MITTTTNIRICTACLFVETWVPHLFSTVITTGVTSIQLVSAPINPDYHPYHLRLINVIVLDQQYITMH